MLRTASDRGRVRAAAGFWGCFAFALICDSAAWGQIWTQGNLAASFIEPPRSVGQYLRDAERAIADERYSDAVIQLGDLLQRESWTGEDDELTGQDYFLAEDEPADAKRMLRADSLLRRARRMLGELPASALETYELRHGPAARRDLAEAVDERNWDAVRSVRRRYFHTPAGYRASWLLAQRQWLGGHPLAASLLLDDIVDSPRAIAELGDAVLLMHAAACRLSGRSLPDVPAARDASVTLAGERRELPAAGELGSWIEATFRVHGDSGRNSDSYPIAGGQPDRNGGDAGEMPLSNVRWMQPTTASPRQDRSLREKTEEFVTSGTLAPPSWTPLRVGGTLLMRSTERLLGVDYETGKLVWEYPWTSPSEQVAESELAIDMLEDKDDADNLLVQRVWNDRPYGQVTSDGQRAYLIEGLSEIEVMRIGPFQQRATRPSDTSSNTLVALSLESEGKIRWSVGGDSPISSSLSDAFFLGPPLPIDGRLYVMAEIAGDVNLCCLAARTGELLWRQQLVAVESGAIEVDPVRRVAGAMPTYHEGLLICPTGAGVTVAVNLADRTLRWGAEYRRNTDFDRRASSRSVDQKQLMQRWTTGVAVASGRTALVTPIESDRLLAFDLPTGEIRYEQNRVHQRYLAGIRDGLYFVVGPDNMRAYDLSDGKLRWSTPGDLVAAGQKISGRGVFGGDDYFLPTTTNELIRVSLRDGSVLQRRVTNYPLGNLVAVGGEMISQSTTKLAVAFGEATLEPRVESMLAEDPDNFEALVRKSELLIQRGKRREALEILESARSRRPDSDAVHLLSVSAMLGILREDSSAGKDLFAELDALIEQPARRAELISLRVRSALDASDYLEAIGQLMALSDLVGDARLQPSETDVVTGEANRQCTIDSWIAARVGQIAAEAGTSALAEVNRTVREGLAARQNGSHKLLRRLVMHFGLLEGSEPIRRELFERLQVAKEPLAMERLAVGAVSAADLDSLADDRLALLGRAYGSGGLVKDADRVAAELDSRGAGELAKSVLAAKVNLDPGYVEPNGWPDGVSVSWESSRTRTRMSSGTNMLFGSTKVIAGEQFRGWHAVRSGVNSLAIRDPNGVLRPVPVEGDRNSRHAPQALLSGGLLVVYRSNQIVAIDLFDLLSDDVATVLWTRSLGGDGEPIAKRRSEMNDFDDQVIRNRMNAGVAQSIHAEFRVGPIAGNRLLVLQGGELLCWDLMTGEQLWRNSDAPASGVVVRDGARVAVVSADTGKMAMFNLWDGRQTESKPWEHGTVWSAAGRHVLCYSAAARESSSGRLLEIKLVNPFNDDVVRRLATPPASRTGDDVPASFGRVVNDEFLALFDRAGTATVWELASGREVFRGQNLPAYPDLNGLHATLIDGQLLLLPQRRTQPRDPTEVSTLQTKHPPNHHQVSALLAVSVGDGRLNWQREFEEPWGMTTPHPWATPALVLARGRSVFRTTRSRTREIGVLVLDVDSSQTMAERRRQVPSRSNEIETQLTVQPQRQQINCDIGLERLQFQFGDQESPEGTDGDVTPAEK